MRNIIVIFLVLISMAACNKDEGPEPTSFTATIDGDEIQFTEPRATITTLAGTTFLQEITARTLVADSIDIAMSLVYAGDITSDDYDLVAAFYYEDNFSKEWSCFCPELLELQITKINGQNITGTFGQLIVEGRGGSVNISNGSFVNIPIEKVDL